MRSLSLTLVLLAVPALAARAQECDPDPLADLLLLATPPLAQVGETVTLSLTNLSADCTYTLPTPCLYVEVLTESCGGDAALIVPCVGAAQSLAPGATITATWDQTTQSGAQVPEGVWAFKVSAFAPTGEPGLLCAFVQVGTSCASPYPYGWGSAGTGELVPGLSTLGGAPSLGNADFQLAVTNAVGGSTAVVLGSLAPSALDLGFGTVLVDPDASFLVSSIALSGVGGVEGQGIGFLAAPIPAVPGLVGLELFFQAAVIDAASTGGLSLTPGVHAAICP